MSDPISPPQSSLRDCCLAALGHLVPPGVDAPELALVQELARHSPLDRLGPAFHNHLGHAPTALTHLTRALQLRPVEVFALVLLICVESEPIVGRACACLQAPLGGSRPTLGLLVQAYAQLEQDRPPLTHLATLTTGVGVRTGLFQFVQPEAPLAERMLALPTHLLLALCDQDAAYPTQSPVFDADPDLHLPRRALADADRFARLLVSEPCALLVIRSSAALERRAAARAVARAMQRPALLLEGDTTAGLAPLLLLRRAVPVFSFDLAPGDRKVVPTIPGYDGPILALAGPDGILDTGSRGALRWTPPTPNEDERRELWIRALGPAAADLAADLAANHRHGAARIAELGRLARQSAVVRPAPTEPPANAAHSPAPTKRRAPTRTEPDLGSSTFTPHTLTRVDVVHAARNLEGGPLAGLAELLPDDIPDAALVLPPGGRHDLDALLARCRGRDRPVEGLGASALARQRHGVCALFVGPSGTGKTLAAGWLASRLGLPLYRVDLAAVTSKYIGETEKNLAQLLAHAEHAEVILLFDEADSMFAKRTDVRDANDRFANAQTNYLLQRIESFDGITLLTSNSRARFDDAFARRLDVILEFQHPSPTERRHLWQSHLGSTLGDRAINLLAASLDLAGGHVRNIVLAAAAVARGRRRSIRTPDLLAGIDAECRKLGKPVPPELQAELRDRSAS